MLIPREIWVEIGSQCETDGFSNDKMNLMIAVGVDRRPRNMKKDGLCYLKMFDPEVRISMYLSLGWYPSFRSLSSWLVHARRLPDFRIDMVNSRNLNNRESEFSQQNITCLLHASSMNYPQRLVESQTWWVECGKGHINHLKSFSSYCRCDMKTTLRRSCELHSDCDDPTCVHNMKTVIGSRAPLAILTESRVVKKILEMVDEHDNLNFRIATSQMSFSSSPSGDLLTLESMTPASCGHLSIVGFDVCSLICDDYINKSGEGLCYLLASTDKLKHFFSLGYYPLIKTVLSKMSHGSFVNHMISTGSDVKFCHVDMGYGLPVINVRYDCDSCGYIDSHPQRTITNYKRYSCPKCHFNNHSYLEVNSEAQECRMGSLIGFSISALIENLDIPPNYTCPDVQYYHTEVDVPYTGQVQKDGDMYTIRVGPHELIGDIIKIKNFVHDYVASCWMEDTDEKLALLGIEYPASDMTPDSINIENMNVLELGTSFIDNEAYLQKEFKGKQFKYEQEIEHLPVRLNILIVSRSCVASNLNLSHIQIQELCARYCMVKPLEQIISEIEGSNVFQSKDTTDVALVKKIFRSMQLPTLQSPTYKTEEINYTSGLVQNIDEVVTRNILREGFKKTSEVPSQSESVLDDYLSGFTCDNSRTDLKRISNIPAILHDPDEGAELISYSESTLPGYLEKLWKSSSSVKKEIEDLSTTISNARNDLIPDKKHLSKLSKTFCMTLNASEKLDLAMTGVGAKMFANENIIKEKEAHSKKSFNPSVDTFDIEDFHTRKTWFSSHVNKFNSSTLRQAVLSSKSKSTAGIEQESTAIFKSICNTEIMAYSYMISEIFMELSISYKQWSKPSTMMFITTPNGIRMIVHNSKGHLFASFCFPRTSKILSTDKIGPKIFFTKSHMFTDFCSFNEPTLEHFIKAGPYMGAILAHLMSVSGESQHFSTYCREVAPQILLLYMNNKTDVEELITSQRYLFMKLLEDVGNNPYGFVSRFPEVLRSRLTAHYLKKTTTLLSYYNENSILKIPKRTSTMIMYDYVNLKSLFFSGDISIEQKINEFYFGYVISKERGRGNDRTFKVLKKILQQEYDFRDKVAQIFTSGLSTPKFCTNRHVLKVFSHIFKTMLKKKLGDNHEDIIFNDFCTNVAQANFSVLATLKASSRKHPQKFNLPDSLDNVTMEDLKKLNPEEAKKRPKVLESLIEITKWYLEDTKKHFVKSHYQKSKDLMGSNFFVMSKSADASKWCQGHHSSHFAAFLLPISPPQMSNFISSTLSLWPRKRLSFPLQQVKILLNNRDTPSNSLFSRFREDFFSGTGIFTQKCGNKIEVISGMFQGILHTTSSLYHTMVQEVMKLMVSQMLTDLGHKHVITIVQGSDDSGMMISIEGPMNSYKVQLCRRLLDWKEQISHHLSIYPSVEKSSIGTFDLIEYNSEWYIRHRIIKPTFRWISASMATSVTERFIDRIRNFNNVLTECLSGGASTLECAVVQLFQCSLHYMLLGIMTQATAQHVIDLILKNPEPLLGFFPCDFDVCASIPGIEFQLFTLHKFTSYGYNVKSRFDSDTLLSYTPEEAPSYMQTKDLNSSR
jgi:hypothetical protein